MHSEDDEPLLEDKDIPSGAWHIPLAPDDLRDAVWNSTVSVVRGQRRKRKALHACLLAAVYVGGLATSWLLMRDKPVTETPQLAAQSPSGPAVFPVQPESASLDSLLMDREQFALNLASSSREGQIELLKAAGDRSLDAGNINLALSCYQKLLSLESPPKNQRTDYQDTWLLRSLKQARLQEESHDPSQS